VLELIEQLANRAASNHGGEMCLSDISRQLKRTAQKLKRLAPAWHLHDLEERFPGEFVA